MAGRQRQTEGFLPSLRAQSHIECHPPAGEARHREHWHPVQCLELHAETGSRKGWDQPRLLESRASGIFLFVQRSLTAPLTARSFHKPGSYFQQHPAAHKLTQTPTHHELSSPPAHTQVRTEPGAHALSRHYDTRPHSPADTASEGPSSCSAKGRVMARATSSSFRFF